MLWFAEGVAVVGLGVEEAVLLRCLLACRFLVFTYCLLLWSNS